MSRSGGQGFRIRIDRTVAGLRGSGLAEAQLRWGALVALEQGLPLRDSIVLRHARQRAEMETPRARAAWERALTRCRDVLDAATMRNWIEPIELVGESAGLLVLTAPTAMRAFLDRRYSPLLGEAVRGTGEFGGVRFASITLPIPMREVHARG